MRLVVDTSALIGDVLRPAGRARLADERLELVLPEAIRGEVEHELPRRIQAIKKHRELTDAQASELAQITWAVIDANLDVVDELFYAAAEDEARARCPQDATDWPLVACALALECGIWSADSDLFGTGVATWTTEILAGWLERHPEG